MYGRTCFPPHAFDLPPYQAAAKTRGFGGNVLNGFLGDCSAALYTYVYGESKY